MVGARSSVGKTKAASHTVGCFCRLFAFRKKMASRPHGGKGAGTKVRVRVSASLTMSQSSTSVEGAAPRAPASGVLRTGSQDAHELTVTVSLEDQVFSLVYRQMHALWGRYRPDFDDLVQVAAEQALRSLPSFRRESELGTWTYRICYHTVKKHQRWSTRWLRRFTLDLPHADAQAPAATASETLEARERAARLHRALDRLTAKRRAVLVMRDLEGLGIAEIATIVTANEATVRSRLRDARRDLSSLLADDAYFGDRACSTEVP
jgi:RNA polymerase sigma-70 factor (ECF subfamily)